MQSLEWVQRLTLRLGKADLVATARRCERGTTVIEYALIASLLAIMAIAGLNTFGTGVRDMYMRLGTAVSNAG